MDVQVRLWHFLAMVAKTCETMIRQMAAISNRGASLHA